MNRASLPSKYIMAHHVFEIDTAKMPPYLGEHHFTTWRNSFDVIIKKLCLKDPQLDDIRIEFSDERKIEKYGSNSIDEIKNIIRSKWNTDNAIEKILDKIKDKKDYQRYVEELCGTLHKLNQDNNIYAELLSFFDDIEFEYRILGEYHNDKKLIVLYTFNIERSALDNKNAPEKEFERVFIHELFHAYHYENDKGELVNRRDYTVKVVKESLASAFEWHYCNEYAINGTDELMQSWWLNDVLIYPYSGARNLIDAYCGLNEKKFCDVFKKSLDDADGAMRILLDPFDFYRIKNAVSIIEKSIKKKASGYNLREAFDIIMNNTNIGKIVRREIPIIIRYRKNIRDLLLDKSYCQKNFSLPYAVLSMSGGERYYADPELINNKEYYICSEFKPEMLQKLLDWLWANR